MQRILSISALALFTACTSATSGGGGAEASDAGGGGSGSGSSSGASSSGGSSSGGSSSSSTASSSSGSSPGGGSSSGSDDAGNSRADAAGDADAATGMSSGGAGAHDAGPACVTSAAKGSCGPYLYPAITGSNGSNTTVGQDVWNPISGWSQTLYATDPGSWQVTANMPLGNTAVVSFPNTGESYDSNLLTSFSSLYSSFSETMNPTSGTSAEAGYDIWLNDWNNEVMIQHDMVNRGGPCGPVLATASFGGHGGVPTQSWNLCQYGSEIIWQLPAPGNGNVYGEHSGSVDVLAMLEWLVNNGGYLPKGSNLTAIGYGFEVCSTGGVDETFEVNSFTITSEP
jgi:hypothetical protein